jgi:VWFA-related protein
MRNLLPGLRRVATWVVCGGILGLVPITVGQQQVTITPRSGPPKKSTAPAAARLRMDLSMVLVPVVVTDAVDKPVLDLSRERFRVFEDNVEQKIASFAFEDGPVSVGFVFDASSSMKNRMVASVEALQRFVLTAIPGDEFSLVQFSDRPEVVTGFTKNTDDILSSVAGIQPSGWTALCDAIVLAAQQMKAGHNTRKALVVLTDGDDNNSRYSEKEVRNLVRESDVRVYSVGIFERPRLLEDLALDTGGRAFHVHKLNELPSVVERLARELRSEYVLGYVPNNAQNDGKYRKVRVELTRGLSDAPFSVYWRGGYYARAD